MKKLIIFTVLFAFTFSVNAEVSDNLINALIQVESSNNDSTIGDSGRAVGCLQIWKVVVDDVNRISKVKKFTYNDRKDRQKSIQIAKIYLNHYGRLYQRKTGRAPTDEIYSRIWNGGPKGYSKKITKKYWKKVKFHL